MPFLFAQAAAPPAPPVSAVPAWVVIVLGLAVALFLGLAFAGAAWSRSRREWRHAERLRLLEAGWPLPVTDEAAWPKALVCVAIGAVVPVAALVLTTVAYLSRYDAGPDLFLVPVVLGGAGVVSGAALTARLFPAGQRTADTGPLAKPAVTDPDAFDVAGRRG